MLFFLKLILSCKGLIIDSSRMPDNFEEYTSFYMKPVYKRDETEIKQKLRNV